MTALILATAIFIGTHFVPSTPLRPALIRTIGEGLYRGLYSLIALAAITWMCIAYAGAPREPLFTPLRHLPSALMPLAFILLACGLWGNPTIVGADRLLKSEDPARGAIRITRHPIMWAIMLWSGAHLLARGDVKSTIFFGGFLLLAAVGTVLMDARKKSNPDWARFAAVTSNVPFAAIIQGRNRIVWREIGLLRPALGFVVFVVFLLLHPWLFGARPY